MAVAALHQHQNIYAVIDLGSNSFHMLIAKSVAGDLQTIGRVKRKVRLAAGLDKNNTLSLEAMQRGWECLYLFAERLQDIPAENIRIVATATLRLAVNAKQFIDKAQAILNHKLEVISGELEAKTIYKGVAHTSSFCGKQLVVDIGGASTEVIIGDAFEPLNYKSLNMGCVTYLEKYFSDGKLTLDNFDSATEAAHQMITPIKDTYINVGWKSASGASGTVQAIQEIMLAQGLDENLTLDKLNSIKKQAVLYKTIDQLALPGLVEDRRLVFVSGLSILIALFESLEIDSMGLAGGALREGVLYSMVKELQNHDIRKRTIDSFIERYHVDQSQGQRVADLAISFAQQLENQWFDELSTSIAMLNAASLLHEVGLLIEYKRYEKHTAYILKNTLMPGFNQTQHKLLVALVSEHRADINSEQFSLLSANEAQAEKLVRILRLSVILAMRRKNDVLPLIQLKSESDDLYITFPRAWLDQHPLMRTELDQEVHYQKKVGWNLVINTV